MNGSIDAPQRGGPHNDKIAERIAVLTGQGMTHVAGGTKTESVIPTPASATGRKCRRPDITMERKDGSKYYENVGKAEKSGLPIERERDAMADIQGATGVPVVFTRYN